MKNQNEINKLETKDQKHTSAGCFKIEFNISLYLSADSYQMLRLKGRRKYSNMKDLFLKGQMLYDSAYLK